MHEFTIRVDVAKQPAAKYDTSLQLPRESGNAGKAGIAAIEASKKNRTKTAAQGAAAEGDDE